MISITPEIPNVELVSTGVLRVMNLCMAKSVIIVNLKLGLDIEIITVRHAESFL